MSSKKPTRLSGQNRLKPRSSPFTRKCLRAKVQVGIRASDIKISYRCATASDFNRAFPLCAEHPGSYTPET